MIRVYPYRKIPAFQFHIGAIKILALDYAEKYSIKFQFHIGAIKIN